MQGITLRVGRLVALVLVPMLKLTRTIVQDTDTDARLDFFEATTLSRTCTSRAFVLAPARLRLQILHSGRKLR